MTESGWSRDLLESDRLYFEAAAEVLPIPGAVIAALRGAEKLAAGCVVHRVDPGAFREEPDAWLAEVEDRLRALGSPRARLYLDTPDTRLEEALARRGYRSRTEHGFTREAGDGGGAEIDLALAEGEDDWSARRELMRRQEHGVDGHPVDADLWIDLERRKCRCDPARRAKLTAWPSISAPDPTASMCRTRKVRRCAKRSGDSEITRKYRRSATA